MNKIKQHIIMSKNIVSCKSCKKLMMVSYFDNIMCKKCDAKYVKMLNEIRNT